MKIYDRITATQNGCAAAIGLFDSLHPGHRAVIAHAVISARAQSCPAAVLTFDIWDNKDTSSAKSAGGRLLTPGIFESKLRKLGVDVLIRLRFDEIRELPAERFAREMLAGLLRGRTVFCGENFRFGKGAGAGVRELAAFGEAFGFSVRAIPLVEHGGEPCSSSRIRACLRCGDISSANEILGRPYAFDFEVVRGRGLARELGMPTANQPFPSEYCVPLHGVYASVANIDGKTRPAVTNIGIRPTVDENAEQVLAETHIHGFEGDLYGQNIPVGLLEMIRPEKKFESVPV